MADIVARRAIAGIHRKTRTKAEAKSWIENSFMLPTDAKKCDLFGLAGKRDFDFVTEQIVLAVRDRLTADEKRGAAPNGYWCKRFLETLEWPEGRPPRTRLD